MSTSQRKAGCGLAALLVTSLVTLVPPAAAFAQTTSQAPALAPPQLAPHSVTVTGQRGSAGDSRLINAARSRVLSRHLASGCNYLSPYSAAEDELTQRYMRDMGLEDSMSNEAERFDEFSPDGDASDETTLARRAAGDADPAATAIGGCGPMDRRFAAGRNRILRKDKSLGEAYTAFDNQDYARAREQATIGWNKVGYAESALLLAKLHLYGLGTPQSTPQAVAWLEKIALDRFDPSRDRVRFDPQDPEFMTARVEATLTLARIYLRGMRTPKDPARANKWFAKAAEIGFVPANDTLGMAAMNGFGMPKSARQAAAYFREAAEAGYAPAQYKLARLHYLGDAGVPQDLKLAGAWFAQAAKAGHPGALYAAGRMLDLGEGVPADPKRAIVYYKEAALKSDADAQQALATYFYAGEEVPRDLATARKLFAAAAQQGQVDAMFNLGAMTARAEAGVKDLATAYVWFTLAQEAGHPDAAGARAAIDPLLTPADRARVDAVLKPTARRQSR